MALLGWIPKVRQIHIYIYAVSNRHTYIHDWLRRHRADRLAETYLRRFVVSFSPDPSPTALSKSVHSLFCVVSFRKLCFFVPLIFFIVRVCLVLNYVFFFFSFFIFPLIFKDGGHVRGAAASVRAQHQRPLREPLVHGQGSSPSPSCRYFSCGCCACFPRPNRHLLLLFSAWLGLWYNVATKYCISSL